MGFGRSCDRGGKFLGGLAGRGLLAAGEVAKVVKSSEERFIEVMRSRVGGAGFAGAGAAGSSTGVLSNCSNKCEKSRLFSRRS